MDSAGAESEHLIFGLIINGPSTAKKFVPEKKLLINKRLHPVPRATLVNVTKRGIVTIKWDIAMRVPKNLTYI